MPGVAGRGEPRRRRARPGGPRRCPDPARRVGPDRRLRRDPAPGPRPAHRPIGTRGAYKVYAGAAEVDARLRFYGTDTASNPAARRSCGSASTGRWCSTRSIASCSGRRAVGRRWRAAPCWTSLLPAEQGRTAGRSSRHARGAGRDELPALLAAERGAVRSDVLARAHREQHQEPPRATGTVAAATRTCRAGGPSDRRGRPAGPPRGASVGGRRRPSNGRAKVVAGVAAAAGAPPDAELIDALIGRSRRQGRS